MATLQIRDQEILTSNVESVKKDKVLNRGEKYSIKAGRPHIQPRPCSACQKVEMGT